MAAVDDVAGGPHWPTCDRRSKHGRTALLVPFKLTRIAIHAQQWASSINDNHVIVQFHEIVWAKHVL